MKNEPSTISERIQEFSRELAIALQRITGRTGGQESRPTIQPASELEQSSENLKVEDDE